MFVAGIEIFFGFVAGALILAAIYFAVFFVIGLIRQVPKIPQYWKETAPTEPKK